MESKEQCMAGGGACLVGAGCCIDDYITLIIPRESLVIIVLMTVNQAHSLDMYLST